jgi:ectoine hydroxylase-related dioxygenase (phytanoyl-CoA dioxygenase family)
MLTDAQRAAYDRDGFIVVPDVFSAEDVAELRRVTDEFVSASATVTANDAVYDLEDTHSADEPRVRRLKAPHAIHPVYMRAPRSRISDHACCNFRKSSSVLRRISPRA